MKKVLFLTGERSGEIVRKIMTEEGLEVSKRSSFCDFEYDIQNKQFDVLVIGDGISGIPLDFTGVETYEPVTIARIAKETAKKRDKLRICLFSSMGHYTFRGENFNKFLAANGLTVIPIRDIHAIEELINFCNSED